DRLGAGLHERAAELGDLAGPGVERVARREAGADPAQGGVPLADRRAVLGWEPGAGWREPAERPVEVGAPGGRPALHHGQAIGREHERRELRAQLLGRAEVRAVQPRALLRADEHLGLRRGGPASPVQRHTRRLLAEADQLRLVPRTRREALRAYVQRLEEVRLA